MPKIKIPQIHTYQKKKKKIPQILGLAYTLSAWEFIARAREVVHHMGPHAISSSTHKWVEGYMPGVK